MARIYTSKGEAALTVSLTLPLSRPQTNVLEAAARKAGLTKTQHARNILLAGLGW